MQLIIAEEYLAEDGISHNMGVFTSMELAIKTVQANAPQYAHKVWESEKIGSIWLGDAAKHYTNKVMLYRIETDTYLQ